MQTIIALLFFLLLGVMVKAQGWFALLWVPLGFVISLFVTAKIARPILLGLPRAIHLVSSGEMRAAVYRRLLFSLVQISTQTLTNLTGSFTSIATRVAGDLTDTEAQLFPPRRRF